MCAYVIVQTLLAFLSPQLVIASVDAGSECAIEFTAPLLLQTGSVLPYDVHQLHRGPPYDCGFNRTVVDSTSSPTTECRYQACGFAGRPTDLQRLGSTITVSDPICIGMIPICMLVMQNAPAEAPTLPASMCAVHSARGWMLCIMSTILFDWQLQATLKAHHLPGIVLDAEYILQTMAEECAIEDARVEATTTPKA